MVSRLFYEQVHGKELLDIMTSVIRFESVKFTKVLVPIRKYTDRVLSGCGDDTSKILDKLQNVFDPFGSVRGAIGVSWAVLFITSLKQGLQDIGFVQKMVLRELASEKTWARCDERRTTMALPPSYLRGHKYEERSAFVCEGRRKRSIGLALDTNTATTYATDLSGGVYTVDMKKKTKTVLFPELGYITGIALA
ncbi:alcohol dehydrogenase [Fusarium acutatum]|uniref:Alcohol dehydrogenase n=1 Tax=Fusarium acutatum TaxID=78861 RepID=A0A8H4NNT5_9HYPO|nr:alcohol dehydrogenase [Fusarium acutatum]